MNKGKIRVGIVAPGSRIDADLAERAKALAGRLLPEEAIELVFHPQCFQSAGHFAGDDEARARAFLEVANDPEIDALWWARGGYGACRLVERIIPELGPAARAKTYLGYSDAGFVLAALYRHRIGRVAHGPVVADLKRENGEAAFARSLAFLAGRGEDALEPAVRSGGLLAAFNITILSHLIGTPWLPDLSRHILMLEDVSEHHYRIDRALWHITSHRDMRRAAGLMLGRCSLIPPNDPDFAQTEEEIARHWCEVSGIAYLGRADIGHDADNKIVPFGKSA